MVRRTSAVDEGSGAMAPAARHEDARLLRRIARGDRGAFEALYRLYHPRLSRFLASLLRKPELVEEVVNDTLLAVWRKPDSYNGASKVSTWVFAIAYRKALKARRRLDEPIEDDEAETRASEEDGPEQRLDRRQVHEALLSAMEELSLEHRTVVDLTYFHDIGYREIAEIMACPVDTVKTRMFHARRRLKTVLAGRLADWL
ncbi:MAG TPA: sigma-70 family RNA polymerase sigma factor [Caulobacteraceae bacterium]|jgi:RNA polymerase sigma-70 factor (ECF subfamily)|nr:sigma-70 family RNA polymerase sigma factor [Caulobacteraceae bacterium]